MRQGAPARPAEGVLGPGQGEEAMAEGAVMQEGWGTWEVRLLLRPTGEQTEDGDPGVGVRGPGWREQGGSEGEERTAPFRTAADHPPPPPPPPPPLLEGAMGGREEGAGEVRERRKEQKERGEEEKRGQSAGEIVQESLEKKKRAKACGYTSKVVKIATAETRCVI